MKISRYTYFLLLFIAGILFRRTGIPGSLAFLALAGFLLGSTLINSGIIQSWQQSKRNQGIKISQALFIGLAFLFLLARYQYWIQGELIFQITLLLSIIFLFLIPFQNHSKNIFRSLIPLEISRFQQILLLSTLLILSLTGVLLNAREFHNTFRSTRYEEYIRGNYPDSLQTEANLLIDQNKCLSLQCKEEARNKCNQAFLCDSLRDYEQALKWFNYAVDLDPDEPEYYYQRGHLKLIKMDINEEQARSAIVDFNRAIELKSDFAYAYYFRGIAFAYLDRKEKVCPDMKYAKNLDTALIIIDFTNKFCPDSGSLSLE